VGRLLVPNEEHRGVDTEGFVVRDDLRRLWGFSRDGVLRSLEDTLERTGLDRLDIVYLHDPTTTGGRRPRKPCPCSLSCATRARSAPA
jgi:aryl-alcohol dehydrogenase-like predicted oxidoreductase